MKRSQLFIILPLMMMSCNQFKHSASSAEDYIALTWEFLGNQAEGRYYDAKFVMQNKGEVTLGDAGWTLYVNQQGSGVVEESVTGNVVIEHVNGDLLRISPKDGFKLEPGGSVEITYRNPGWMIKESEVPLTPFMVYGDENQRAVLIGQYEVMPFPALDRIFPPSSGIVLPDAAWVYGQNSALSVLEPGKTGVVLPTPLKEIYSGESFQLDKNVKICREVGLENEAEYLAEMLQQVTGSVCLVTGVEERGAGTISLLKVGEKLNGQEAYQLSVTPAEGIVITGGGEAGVFYGIQTLLSMIPPEAWSKKTDVLNFKAGLITDKPAFAYRGFHLDIARNFIEPEHIKRLIDVMAYYKLNKLHLHLTDDEGWRIEIPSIPELTQLGAYRGYTIDERDHLIPAYGSGPDPMAESNHGSGFLSRETYMELLRYADSRHIEVIPEINFPGHARAAIKSMEARYERLMKEGKNEEAGYYRLIDPEDASRYSSAQIFNDNVVCVCIEGPYRLYETVVDEIADMYSEAGLTLTTMHTGGDEVPRGVWTASPICQSFLEEHPEIGETANLQAYFGERLFEILKRKGMVMAGWEEVAMKRNEEGRWIPNPKLVGQGVLPYVWNSLDENLDLGNRLANAGFPVVLCNVNNFYFDLAYTHHPAERGQHWGGFVNTRSAFNFIPYDVFNSTITDKYGYPYDPEEDFKGMERLKSESYERVIGLQAELWSETVKGGTMAEYYYLPKMIGFAERAWAGQAAWGTIPDLEDRVAAMDKDWNRFANIVGHREMPRLDYLFGGYNYRLPPPGAVIKEGRLYANTDFPGLVIRYTTDGSEPDASSAVYEGPVEVTGKVLLKTFNTLGRGSRVSVVED